MSPRRRSSENVIAVRADAADFERTQTAVHEVVAAFGGLDIVLANAGISGSTPLGPTTSPLGRMAEAREIASVVLFLASDASAMMAGNEIVVDGGLTQSPSGSPAATGR